MNVLELLGLRTRPVALASVEALAGRLEVTRRDIADLQAERTSIERQTSSRRELQASAEREVAALAERGREAIREAAIDVAHMRTGTRYVTHSVVAGALRHAREPREVAAVILALVGEDAVRDNLSALIAEAVPEGLDAEPHADALQALDARLLELEREAERLTRELEAATGRYVERHRGADPRALLED